MLNEMTQHLLSHIKVGDDPVFQRPDRHDRVWRFTNHFLGFTSNGQHLESPSLISLDSNYRGLTNDNPSFTQKNQGIGSAKINSEIFCKPI